MVNSNQEKTERYVRLAETTLFHAPDCYMNLEPDLMTATCWLCAVSKQCEERQEVGLR